MEVINGPRFVACAGDLFEVIGRSRRVIDDVTANELLRAFKHHAFNYSAKPVPRLQRLAQDCRAASEELAEAWDEAKRWRRCQDIGTGFEMFVAATTANFDPPSAA